MTRVSFWVALGVWPLAACNVNASVPPSETLGVPYKANCPVSVYPRASPVGTELPPTTEIVGVGTPDTSTGKYP